MADTVTATATVTHSHAWKSLSSALAEWTAKHLVNRTDTYGIYTPDPFRAKLNGEPIPLTTSIIEDHYDALSGAPLIGLYTTDPKTNLCRWLCLDIDAHKETRDDIFKYACELGRRMWATGVYPIIEHSNGNGGFKIWVVFAKPVPARLLRSYGHWLVKDAAKHGVTEVEVFPKQNALKEEGAGSCGNYVRLFGKHHKRDWFSEFWDLQMRQWFRGADAPEYLLTARVDNNPESIPLEAQNYIPPKPEPKPSTGGSSVVLGDDWLSAFTGDLRTLRLDKLFEESGLLEEEEGDGKFRVACPWKHEHTADTGGSAIWLNPDSFPQFHCLHVHCAGRSLKHVCEFFGVEAVNASCEKKYVAPIANERVRDLESVALETLTFDPIPTPKPVTKGETIMRRLLTIDELMGIPKPNYLIDRILEEQSIACIWGSSNVGKTFHALDMALSVATGIPYQGHDVTQGNVVYLISEGWRSFGERVAAWCQFHKQGFPAAFRPIVGSFNLIDPDEIKAFTAELKKHPPKLLVIDTMSYNFLGDEDRKNEIQPFINVMQTLCACLGVTILLIHHPGKDSSRGERGSYSFRCALDTSIEVQATAWDKEQEEQVTSARIACHKQRNSDFFRAFHLTRVKVGNSLAWKFDGTDKDIKNRVNSTLLDDIMREIANSENGLSGTEVIAKELGGKTNVEQAMKKLAAAKAIEYNTTTKKNVAKDGWEIIVTALNAQPPSL